MRRKDAHSARSAWLVVAGLVAFMLVLAGCGSSSDSTSGGSGGEMQKLGKGEGQLNLISWAGYVEPEWVKPFEAETGCKVNNKTGGTSDEMVQLMGTGEYDGVSASGNASARLVAAGDVSPVNVDLVPNYKTIFSDLKDQPYNTFDGVHYGIPHGRGANLLMWNDDDVKPAPDSWDVMLDPKVAAKYKGKISVYDESSYIADAAMYLMYHQPDLGIENPYELNDEQFEAAVDLLKEQRANVGEYWSEAAKQISAFANGDVELGTTWQYQYFALQGEGEPVAASPASQGFLPKEGATGWSDTWMISSKAKHPNCAYAWMSYITEPKPQSEVAQYFGEAPANGQACKLTGAAFCKAYHTTDKAFADKLWYWTTPISQCLDGRSDTQCTDYGDWTQAWTEIKG